MMCFITKPYKLLQNRRTAFYGVMLALFIVLFNSSVVFANSYTVEEIKVDVTASNAVEAREKAFEEAQVKGYKMLAERFLSEEELETFETPDINTVSAYVKDFEVSKEKLSSTRYAGVYKIRYSAKTFTSKNTGNDILEEDVGTSKARPQKGRILIFPFFAEAGYPVLWRTNPFMKAWIRARDNNMSAPAIVPVGDVQDISAIKDDEALRYNPTNLDVLKRRYRAGHVAVLVATPELMSDGTKTMTVAIYQAQSRGPELIRQVLVRSHQGEAQEQFYNRVIREINQAFQSPVWEAQSIVAGGGTIGQLPPLTGPIHTMVAQLKFSTMRQWVETKKSLERSYGVSGVSVKSLSPRSATLTVTYQGSIENLRQALQQNGVGLNDPLMQQSQYGASQSSVYQLFPRL